MSAARHLALAALLALAGGGAAAAGHVVHMQDGVATEMELVGPMEADRYVVFSTRRVSTQRATRGTPFSVSTVAADCSTRAVSPIRYSFNTGFGTSREPQWQTFESSDAPGQPALASLAYTPLDEFLQQGEAQLRTVEPGYRNPRVPDLLAAVRAACEMGRQPAGTQEIAQHYRASGGLDDVKELACRVGPPGMDQFRWTVRYSESSGGVQLNDRWLGEGSAVTPGQISFHVPSIALRGTIDRASGAWNSRFESGSLAVWPGTCAPVASSHSPR